MSPHHERGIERIGPESYPEDTYLPEPDSLAGRPVHDESGAVIGTVEDVYVDSDDEYIRYIGVGREGGERHLVPVDSCRLTDDGDAVVVPYAGDRLGARYERDEDITPDRESEIYGQHGRQGYWEDVRARQTVPAATPEIARAEGERGEELAARQTVPAPTPEIAVAEAEAMVKRGRDTRAIRVKRWGI